VDSGEQFRLVASDYTTLFKGLLEIKQEYKGNVKFDFLDDSTHTKLAHSLDADPTLNPSSNNPPRTSDTNANTTGRPPVSHDPITISPTPSSPGITILDDMHETAKLNTTSVQFKRKLIHPDELYQSNDEVVAKKARLSIALVSLCLFNCIMISHLHYHQHAPSDTHASSSGPSNILQNYFKDTKAIAPPAAKPLTSSSTTNVFHLPVGPEFAKLTKSQRLFSIATQTDVRSLKISGNIEFYLFMEMRAEHQWASFRMTPPKWVVETREYNTRLQRRDANAIHKNPRALLDKLIEMEVKILERITTNNFKCMYAP